MVLRFIFRHLANNEQLVQRLSESYVVRRFAQLVVAGMHKTQSLAAEHKLQELTPERFRSFFRALKQNMKEEIEDAKIKLKEQSKGKGP